VGNLFPLLKIAETLFVHIIRSGTDTIASLSGTV